MASVTLTAYDMGPHATEADFDNWASYVNEHIDEKCGFPVTVEQFRFANSGEFEDAIEGTKLERETISEALRVLYEEWCADGEPLSQFTYSIFDSDPSQSGGNGWTDYCRVTIEAGSSDQALSEVLALAVRRARECGEYSEGDQLWATVWDAEGIASTGTVRVG